MAAFHRSDYSSSLESGWAEIREILKGLPQNAVLGDRREVYEIDFLVQDLVRRSAASRETSEVRMSVLRDIFRYIGLYYGPEDSLLRLAKSCCVTEDEARAEVDLLWNTGFRLQALTLAHETNTELEDAFLSRIRKELQDKSEPYELLIRHLERTNYPKAVEIAEMGKDRTKDDQTIFYLFLLEDALSSGDEARFDRLWAAAHRRRLVQKAAIDEAFPDIAAAKARTKKPKNKK